MSWIEDFGIPEPDCQLGDDRSHAWTEKDPLYFHKYFNNIKIIHKTQKAYLIKFNDKSKHWVPKKLCKKIEKNSIYIWKNFKLNAENKYKENK